MPVAQHRLDALQVRKLIHCVRERDRPQIRKLVQHGIPFLVNYGEDHDGDTPLIVCAKENDDDMIRFLTSEMLALPDFGDANGVTPAMHAAQLGNVEALQALLEAGADMRARDNEGRNVLFYCVGGDERRGLCLTAALEADADVNQAANDGRTAFFAACEASQESGSSCFTLLAAGARPEAAQSGSGRTPLMAACACGSASVAGAALAAGAEPDARDRLGAAAVHHAARAGGLDCLVRLSACGASFAACDKRLNTALHAAAAAGQPLCLRFLAQRGADPAARNVDNETPRMVAKAKGFKDCLKELRRAEKAAGRAPKNNEAWALRLYDWTVAFGERLLQRLQELDPEAVGCVPADDFVQLLEAMRAPWTDDCAKKLLPLFDPKKLGVVDYRDFMAARKYVAKPYLMAAYQPKQKKGKKGKKGGGRKKKAKKPPFEICVQPDDQVQRPADGRPPVTYVPKAAAVSAEAEEFGRHLPPAHPLQDDSVWYLRQPDRTFVNINDCAKHGDLDSLRLALSRGYGTETRDKLFKTPLMVAAHYGNLDVARFLLQAGADVNARDNFKWTPLHHACHGGDLDVVQLLVQHGAAVDAQALNGGTPLLRAIETSNLAVVSFLVSCGAKVLAENRKGNTSQDLARDWADKRVLELISTKVDSMTKKKGKKGGKGKSR